MTSKRGEQTDITKKSLKFKIIRSKTQKKLSGTTHILQTRIKGLAKFQAGLGWLRGTIDLNLTQSTTF